MIMRVVRKFLALTKAMTEEKEPVILTNLSQDWSMPLIPNFRLADTSELDNDAFLEEASSKYGIDKERIHALCDRNNDSMTSNNIKETNDPIKREKDGPMARYIFHYTITKINTPITKLKDRIFYMNGNLFAWMTLGGLKRIKEVKRKNGDVLRFITENFNGSINKMEIGFEKKIRNNINESDIINMSNDGTLSEFLRSEVKRLGLDLSDDIFICYAGENKTVRDDLKLKLEACGVTVWDTDVRIRLGSDIGKGIEDGLKAARHAIILITEEMLRRPVDERKWIEKEIELAIKNTFSESSRMIIPVLINVKRDRLHEISKKILDFRHIESTGADLNEIAQQIADSI